MSSTHRDERVRIEQLKRSEQQTRQRVETSLLRLDTVSRNQHSAHASGHLHPAAAAIQHVFANMGFRVSVEQLAAASHDACSITDLSRQAGGRARQIVLDSGWQRCDLGPLVGVLAGAEDRVVSLIHSGRRYRYTDHASGEQGVVTDALAARFHNTAYTLYAPLPNQASCLWELGRFLWPDTRGDLAAIMTASGTIALLGALFPLATAQIVDALIPSAEAALLVQLGIGLGTAALVIFVFIILLEGAKLRIEGRTTGRLQAALWDRVLKLPTAFFKKFSAGDLNARITDIEAVREALLDFMLSASVTAFFSLFYLTLLFVYLPQLAALAIVLATLLTAMSFAAGWL